MTVFIFLFFYFYLLFVGRGSLVLLSRLNKNNSEDINIFKSSQNIFFPIISLFILGNTLFVNGPTILDLMTDQRPAKIKYGEVIVFNPFILHGNIDFKSDLARIACSVRFQSKHKPIMQKNTDFFKLYNLK